MLRRPHSARGRRSSHVDETLFGPPLIEAQWSAPWHSNRSTCKPVAKYHARDSESSTSYSRPPSTHRDCWGVPRDDLRSADSVMLAQQAASFARSLRPMSARAPTRPRSARPPLRRFRPGVPSYADEALFGPRKDRQDVRVRHSLQARTLLFVSQAHR
eukprot:TRINITY_DN89054_c0_g1_i1.p1 TRINITY_DN89054_c0_g1~~TRINITY_DN89054_c0_g1_i1.p1  ORF type:complete len:158 (-),score=2.00 TRINITY_DN89054_c0_g1_i1:201-674(-)